MNHSPLVKQTLIYNSEHVGGYELYFYSFGAEGTSEIFAWVALYMSGYKGFSFDFDELPRHFHIHTITAPA